jgi:hypothetical protein
VISLEYEFAYIQIWRWETLKMGNIFTTMNLRWFKSASWMRLTLPLLPTCRQNHLHWCTFQCGQLGSGVRRQMHAVIWSKAHRNQSGNAWSATHTTNSKAKYLNFHYTKIGVGGYCLCLRGCIPKISIPCLDQCCDAFRFTLCISVN